MDEIEIVSIDPSKLSDEVKEKYSLEKNNTLKRAAKDNPKDRIEVEIGDSKQPNFKPQVKIKRWDNEVNFSLRAVEDPQATFETVGEVIKYKAKDYEVHMYDKPEASEEGGFEFEWVLPKRPKTNVLSATIQTKELNFYYQPALTQQEIDEGAERPENVVGSYAVYHKTKGGMNDSAGMEYKVGKAFHIYRPKVTDAKGNWTWGELHIDEQSGLLTVTIDDKWLSKAVYPVVVDPTFGYTSAGGSYTNTGGKSADVNYGTPTGGNGTGDKVSVYARKNISAYSVKGGLWLYSDGTLVTNGVGDAVLLDNGTASWKDSPFSTAPSITNSTKYYVGVVLQTRASIYYDTGGGADQGYDYDNNYSSPTNLTSLDGTGYQFSVYVTYTPSGGGAAVKDIIGAGIIPFPR